MTAAGKRQLPDLMESFDIPADILASIKTDDDAWKHFRELPELYLRVRIGYIEEQRRRPEEFNRRLKNFLFKTAAGKMFGNWNDNGRLLG